MGLFGTREELNLSEPGQVVIPEHVSGQVPDVCEVFISWATDGLHEEEAARVVTAVESLRGANGWLPLDALKGVGIMDFKSGPLTFLKGMTTTDFAIVGIWASYGVSGKDKRQIEATAQRLLQTQGHAAAATWALTARPSTRLDLDLLGDQLRDGWSKGVSYVRNKDFIKSFRKWSD